jgi:hypothetical protein
MQALISMGITTPATIAFDGYSPDPRESTAGRSTP